MTLQTPLARPRTPSAMTNAETNAFNHLSRNAEHCVRKNIRVHVENVNTGRTIALCSAEQRASGLFTRRLQPTDLVHEAERALAPLRGVGITPLITVRHHTLHNATGGGTAPVALPSPRPLAAMRQFLSDFMYAVRVPRTQTMDPFGWRRAMGESGRP